MTTKLSEIETEHKNYVNGEDQRHKREMKTDMTITVDTVVIPNFIFSRGLSLIV